MRIGRALQVALLIQTCVNLASCGGGDSSPRGTASDAAVASQSEAVTYHRDIRPVMEGYCIGCHSEGNIGGFSLGFDPQEWESGPAPWAPIAVSAVEQRAMPPWMPDPACRELHGSRRLSDAQLELFRAWRDAGYPQGDPADFASLADPRLDPGEATLTLRSAEGYVPDQTRDDDYRCFLLPHTFERESYLLRTTVAPEAKEQVHHVILFSVDAARVSEAEALDEAEAGPGYTCFGGAGVPGARNIGGWVPGSVPMEAPADSARVLRAGSRIVMQVHYNNDHVDPEKGPVADRTSASFWLMQEGKKPAYRLDTVPLANLDLEIDAGDAHSVQSKTFAAPAAGTVVGVLPHMHTLGTSIELTLEREGDEACLTRIQEWDFHWQQGYRFAESAYVELERGDTLTLTCTYDNSDGDHTVRWGEGTKDEMCLSYLEVRTPFGAERSLSQECPTFDACIDACAEGDARCLAGCTSQTEACASCTAPALGRCAIGRCQAEGVAVQACRRACPSGGACLVTECGTELDAFFGCMEPHLRAGACDPELSTCGG